MLHANPPAMQHSSSRYLQNLESCLQHSSQVLLSCAMLMSGSTNLAG